VGLTHAQNVPDSHPVIYDRIFTNVGGGYSSATGIFTCPQVRYVAPYKKEFSARIAYPWFPQGTPVSFTIKV
jgi:hypothetical protein